MKKKNALITGVLGQDGFYLTNFLLKKNYKVFGVSKNKKIKKKIKNLKLLNENFNNKKNIIQILNKYNINEIYNLASQSSVRESFLSPIKSCEVNAIYPIKILEAIKTMKNNIKFYQASSSEMFGNNKKKSQDEKANLSPVSPYALSKKLAHDFVKFYRENYRIFAVSGILFNHESPLRNEKFVTKKIVTGLVKIYMGINLKIRLGNIYAKRDWGYAKDYVEAMWMMLQQKIPEDFVIANGKSYSIKDFINECAKILKLNVVWIGNGLNEKLILKTSKKAIIVIDKKYFRPIDIKSTSGDFSKAKKKLKWRPKTPFKKIVKLMIDHEINTLKKKYS